jgi:hypothetical protein
MAVCIQTGGQASGKREGVVARVKIVGGGTMPRALWVFLLRRYHFIVEHSKRC